ncbi:MAG: hypothetical protein GY743_23355 [Planctomycetaceae bacterium]|nr:hypothetical protein [Planctomycetaceae bacterium]
MKPTYIYVKTDHSEDFLFGEDIPTNYDVDILLNGLIKSIRNRYPAASVSVVARNQTAVDTDGGPFVENEIYRLINENLLEWLEKLEER